MDRRASDRIRPGPLKREECSGSGPGSVRDSGQHGARLRIVATPARQPRLADQGRRPSAGKRGRPPEARRDSAASSGLGRAGRHRLEQIGGELVAD